MAHPEIDFLVDQDTTRLLSDAFAYEISHNDTCLYNETLLYSADDDYIFDRANVRAIFITLYTVVFACCFFGNLMVILVVMFSRRLRSITNFFLANLAIADFCVSIFCVYQTLLNYLMNSWQLGNLLCKMYMYVHALSYTASILILMVVCIERYLAIVHPMKCRFLLTRRRLRMVIGMVWVLAAIYALPKFFYVETISNHLSNGEVDIICIANIKKHNKNLLDIVNLVFLYLLPLTLMCCLYTRIAVDLWRSGAALGEPDLVTKRSRNGRVHHVRTSSKNALKARRGVIRMLILVVLTFAVCNLPQQVRIVWRYWGTSYDSTSDFSTLLTVSTFLISYINSCLNPLLYAFLSRNFRKAMRELCSHCRGAKNRGSALAMVCVSSGHKKGANMPHSSVVRLSLTQETVTRHSTYKSA